jgi:hypothetical protein
MSDPIEISLDDADRLAEPPLVDFLSDEPEDIHYHITFVPSDEVSVEPTESVTIIKQSSDGARITALLGDVSALCGAKLTRVSHGGGASYTLHLDDMRIVTLADLKNGTSIQVFDRLKQIAETAEIVFQSASSHASIGYQRRPAV